MSGDSAHSPPPLSGSMGTLGGKSVMPRRYKGKKEPGKSFSYIMLLLTCDVHCTYTVV